RAVARCIPPKETAARSAASAGNREGSEESVMLSRQSGFNLNRAQVVDQNFVRFVQAWEPENGKVCARPLDEPIRPGEALTGRDAIERFESQMIARHQDIEARAMRARGEGFYTIGSAGHEGDAVIGRLTRPTDLAFLHYRSGALLAERARQVPGVDFVR